MGKEESVGGEDIYNSEEEELMLTLLSDLYSKLKAIFVSASGLSSCSTKELNRVPSIR